jgi:hypothetical protein
MESFWVGISVLTLMAVWHFMLKKSILDTHRDRLFDLRDQLRAEYIAHGWDLGSPMYKKLRDLVNSYLRFTDSFSLVEFMLVETKVKRQRELKDALKAKFEKEFRGQSDAEQEFIQKFRAETVQVMMSYMILSSGPLVLLSAIMLPVTGAIIAARIVRNGLVTGLCGLADRTIRINSTFLNLLRHVVATIANKILFRDFVEEYSYRQRLTPA